MKVSVIYFGTSNNTVVGYQALYLMEKQNFSDK
jgi:hypothetical protein